MGRLYQIISMGIKCNNQVPKQKKIKKTEKEVLGPRRPRLEQLNQRIKLASKELEGPLEESFHSDCRGSTDIYHTLLSDFSPPHL